MKQPMRFSFQYPRITVLLWLTLALALGACGLAIGTQTVLPGPTNRETIFRNIGEQAAFAAGLPLRDTLLLVLEHPSLTPDAERFQDTRDDLCQLLGSTVSVNTGQPLFNRVETVGRTMLGDERFVGVSGRSILLRAETARSVDQSSDELRALPEVLRNWLREHHDFSLHYVSDGTVNNEMFDLIDQDLDSSLVYTLPITFLILLWAFGSLVAALVPLVIAGVSLVGSLGLSALLSHCIGPVSATASQLVVLLVLAIGIDYSLFMISRIREEVGKGLPHRDAVLRARASTGVAILWSGVIVALSLCGLFLMEDTVLASMALVSIVSVFVTVLGSVHVLPGALLLLGDRLEWGRIPLFHRHSLGYERPHAWLRFPLERPVVALFLSTALLIALGCFAARIQLGSTVEPELLPQPMQSYGAFKRLHAEFPDLKGIDFTVVLSGDDLPELVESGGLDPFLEHLGAFETVKGPLQIEQSDYGTVQRLHYTALGSGNDPANQTLVHRLRAEIIPHDLSSLGVTATLGGTLPFVVDDRDRYTSRTPMVFGSVLALSFLFLLIAFRSIVVPLKAMILNLLSTFAAFGALVLFFQVSIFPFIHYDVIESFVPPLLFSILFGLSMDYHVFLLSRVSEEHTAGHSMDQAVRMGIERTFRTITGAACIMVSVFSVIAMLELPIMKELGLGLAVAVFLDATIIRCILLPASLVLLGKWNWYLPRILQWIPRLRLE